MAFSIEDVNSRTILQQFHALYEKQDATDANVENLDSRLIQESQNRTNADIGLSEQIQDLQNQLDSLGTIFTLKGSVATVDDLPTENNHVGDVWYVQSVSSGYIWIDDNGTERWEQLGLSVDMSNYPTNDDLSTALAGKQDTLTAGTNISIIDNVISATGGTPENMMTTDTDQDVSADKTFLRNKCINIKQSTGSPNTRDLIRFIRSNGATKIAIMAEETGTDAGSYGCLKFGSSSRYVILKIPTQNETFAFLSNIKKYYRHSIEISGYGITCEIITSSATQMSKNDLAEFVYNNFTAHKYPTTIAARPNGFRTGLYATSTTQIAVQNCSFTTDGTSISVSQTGDSLSANEVVDTVTEI